MKVKTVYTWFEDMAKQHPEQIAVQEGGQATTYEELRKQASRLAHLLVALEPTRDGKIGVIQPSSTHLIVALLATFQSGRLYLPMDKKFADKRLQQILNQCQPKVLVTSEEQCLAVKEKLAGITHEVTFLVVLAKEGQIKLYQQEQGQFEAIDLPEDLAWEADLAVTIQPDDANYIFYTSGSTGTAKAILGVHKSLTQFIEWEVAEFGIQSSCRVSQLVQPTFDASLRDIFVPLCTGGTLCIPTEDDRNNISALVQWVDSQQITLIHCVPSLLRVLTKAIEKTANGLAFAHLEHVLVSGEALYVKDVLNWREKVGTRTQLVNLYGATETTMIRTFYCIGELEEELTQVIPVGKPIPKTVVAIINDNHICRTGEIGEIYIKTPFWTKGYLFDEALNKQAFIQNPLVKDREDIVYKTGDLGRYLKDNVIQVLGRIDNQVKLNGIRVEIGEIELAIQRVSGIEQALVTSYVNTHGDNELIAYYTGEEKAVDEWRNLLRNDLNENLLPTYFQHLLAFPLTINGKIDKKALPTPDELRLKEHPYEAPQTSTESKLEEIWQNILDVQRIGRSVSFFAIGGNSLKAIQLISRIYKEFKILVKVVDIFSNPTIEKMAKFLADLAQHKYADITPVAEGPYQATYQQRRLWILDQFEENQVAYNMPIAFELTGIIDREALMKAFEALVQRHESLRTVFERTEDFLYQKVQPLAEANYTIEFVEVNANSQSIEEEAHRLIFQAAKSPLPLEKGPLFKAMLIQLKEDRHFLFMNTHHIISDAWSLNVIARDVLAFYQASLEGKSALEPLLIQYKDYSKWLNQQLAETTEDHQRYWLNQMEGELPQLEMPIDFPRPPKQLFTGSKHFFDLDRALSEPVKAYCQQQEITLFMLLMGTVNSLLYYYAGQKDLIVGIPLAGRNHNLLEDQVGFYVNVIALRTRFDPDASVVDFFQQIKKHMLAAYDHSLFPFDHLVELLQAGGDRSRSSLFDVMVQMQDTQVKNLSLQLPDGIKLQHLDLDFNTSKFDLTFNFEATEEGNVIGWIEYNSSLFLPDTITQMAHLLEAIIREVVQTHAEHTLKSLKKTLASQFGHSQIVQESQFSSIDLSDDF
ncbi:MAG: amino acid adenylation domain-containing protein [Bacteroidota bacterium]